ncbi:probable hydratase (plasmid) [Rhodococcus jostii RHA1]|uniref:Probable hydratase n=1 Tax=Rhodococcus jostii (strain RHA1) TaxID=101510 RepID=Q0RW33_RHOJR|nr:fumarylacetoacetate hydrolase family protein [Rhodococcus jostii]ABH00503.1 probable hydratase [Rhodococcus jostii RHA1]
MKLVTFRRADRVSFGRLEGDAVIDLGPVFEGRYAGLRDVLEQDALDEIRAAEGAATLALSDLELLPPIPDPNKILCAGVNYHAHREEASRAAAEYPTIFPRFADSQVAHGGPLLRPAETARFDYEGELAVVIGRGGRRIPAEKAFDHVAGYSCYNDGSVRDWQRHTAQWLPGKTFPATGGFGPALVTADEVGDPSRLQLTTRVNAEERQSASVADLIFDIPALIAYISTFTPLAPGDVIVSGTPGGVGLFRDPPVFLKPGDVVEVDIPGVGLLVNTVADDVVDG